MEQANNTTYTGLLELSNLKRQKVVHFVSKKHEKRIASFSGFVAKLQQSLKNNDEQLVYYATKRILPFVVLLRETGIIHNFFVVSKESQQAVFGAYLSPGFDARLLVVHLKTSDKYAAALQKFKMFAIPSRQVFISYAQLVKKTKVTGATTLYILNTPKGLLTHMAALQFKVGGEVVCEIQ